MRGRSDDVKNYTTEVFPLEKHLSILELVAVKWLTILSSSYLQKVFAKRGVLGAMFSNLRDENIFNH